MKPSYRQCAEAEAAGIIRERREPLPVEQLIPEDARRLETALGSSRPLPAGQAEELVASAERHLSRRSEKGTRRVLRILDELDREGGRA